MRGEFDDDDNGITSMTIGGVTITHEDAAAFAAPSSITFGAEDAEPLRGLAKKLREGVNHGVPHVDSFTSGDFIEAPGLEELAETLMTKHPGLGWVRDWRVRYLWKKKGGASAGRTTLGKTTLASGLTKFFAKTDFVIWLAADHCRKLESRQLEALLYHEMQHLGVRTDEDGEELGPCVVGHDVEAFFAEVREYGSWKEDLKEMERTYKQMSLPLGN